MRNNGLLNAGGVDITTISHEHMTDPGYCLYGAEYLLSLVDSLSGEIEGVRIAEDIEYVHRMRVATRRIRAALPLYRDCFTPKEFRRWKKEIRAITRALGEARDVDVQIDYLCTFLDETTLSEPQRGEPLFSPAIRRKKKETHGSDSASAPVPQTTKISSAPPGFTPEPAGFGPGIECLILRLQERREALQPAVNAALDRLTEAKVIEEMQDALRRVVVSGTLHHTDIHSPFAYEQAFVHISLCLDDIFLYDTYVSMPDETEMHHAMRIAAKRLRYTLESYAALYDGTIKPQIKSVKNLQDILGDMHDCDVWAEMLPVFMAEEKKRSEDYFGHDRIFGIVEPGLLHLRETRMKERRVLYESLVTTWEALRAEGMWETLRAAISAPHPAVLACLHRHDPDPPHAEQVCRLAENLFDELAALHGMGAHERALLRDAALLHDIGLSKGTGRHHKHSMEFILADTSLPFGERDRQIIANVARYHRRALPHPGHEAFAALDPDAQQTVENLAALLRIADGLDVTHRSVIKTLQCDAGGDPVVISYQGAAEAPAEEAQAIKKSTLFTRVYRQKIVIQWVQQT